MSQQDFNEGMNVGLVVGGVVLALFGIGSYNIDDSYASVKARQDNMVIACEQFGGLDSYDKSEYTCKNGMTLTGKVEVKHENDK